MEKTLSKCKNGTTYQIFKLLGDDNALRFYDHVGLRLGDSLMLVNIINKHAIILIKGSRYAMELKLADQIMVTCND